jgi:quercetin dioxygenase-like cupin family protein
MTAPASARGRLLPSLAGAALAIGLLAGCGSAAAGASSSASATSTGPVSTPLLDKQETTILDQPIAYPTALPAQVSSAIVELAPGQQTGWHEHDVPMYGYVLEGTLSVEYATGVTNLYEAGSAIMEAEGVMHNGTNTGDGPMRVLVVYIGAEGLANAVKQAP